MDLKDFVAGSLTQIIECITLAQKATASSRAWISPTSSLIPGGPDRPIIRTTDGRRYLHEVKFDVAVTVSDEQKAGAGAGIQIFGAKLGAEGELNYGNAAVSRVQFSVPVIWPGEVRPEIDKAVSDRKAANMEKEIRSAGPAHPQGWMG
jgi:hypothetical protein